MEREQIFIPMVVNKNNISSIPSVIKKRGGKLVNEETTE